MSEREDLGLVAVCLAVILLSIGGIAADIVTSLLPGMDGLLLLLVCLMMIVIFSPPLVALVKEEFALRRAGRQSAAPADPPQDAKEGK